MTSEHNVFILYPPSTVNKCNRIYLFDSGDTKSLGSVSLYNIDRIYSYLIENEIGLQLLKVPDDNGDMVFKYDGRTYRSGFDTIICLSDSLEILGYIKYVELQGTSKRPMHIKIELKSSANTEEEDELVISYAISGLVLDKDEENKYKDYLKVPEARKRVKRGYNQYSSHVSSEDNLFLSDLSIVSGEDAIKLDLCYGEKVNPYPDTSFDYYSVGYVAGGDLALYSWTSDTYSVTSLGRKDYYGKPKSYIKTKEGRAFVPKYFTEKGIERKTKINYISGRYLCCSVENLGTKLYDTYLGEWLDGRELISDPYSETNKIYNLSSVLYSDLARIVPSVSNAYLLNNEKTGVFYVYRIIGNWIIFREDGGLTDKILVCGPTLRLHTRISEFNELMFLNDYTIIQKSFNGVLYRVYSGQFKTFVTYGYQSVWGKPSDVSNEVPEEIIPGKDFLNSSLKYYKRIPGNPTEFNEIIATFAGLIFYKDSENRLYYL